MGEDVLEEGQVLFFLGEGIGVEWAETGGANESTVSILGERIGMSMWRMLYSSARVVAESSGILRKGAHVVRKGE